MSRLKDLTGQQFGDLTVLEQADWYVYGKQSHRYAQWKCRCTCGTELVVRGSNLTSGNTTSCGCHRESVRGQCTKRDIVAGVQAVALNEAGHYYQVQHRAQRKGFEFELTREEFSTLRNSACALCGFDEGPVSIDRIDSEKGYTRDNCQPLCRVCQTLKSAFPNEFIIRHINRIHRHLDENGTLSYVLESEDSPSTRETIIT